MSQTLAKKQWFRRHWFIILLAVAVLLIALSVLNFFMTHHKVTAPPLYRLTPTAVKNPLFASQLLLEQQHKKVTVDHGETAHRELKQVWQQSADNAKKTTVMLLSVSQNQQQDIPAMLDWVERGGHLVTFSQDTLRVEKDETDNASNLANYQVNENALLTYLGIKNLQDGSWHDSFSERMQARINASASTSATASSPVATEQTIILASKVLLRLPVTPYQKGVGIVMASANVGRLDSTGFFQKYPQAKPIADYNWFSEQNLKDPSQWQALPLNDNQLTALKKAIDDKSKRFVPAEQALLDVRLGQGRLTITNDNEVFTNPSSGFLAEKQQRQNDSGAMAQNRVWQALTQSADSSNVARLDNAYLLTYLLDGRDQVWLVPDVSVASLPVLLWRNLKWACVAFLLCVIAGFMALPKRFGRGKRYQSDSQTNIFGYFDHVGEYLWQNDQAKALVAINRERLLDKILASYPQLSQSLTQDVQTQRYIDRQQVCEVLANDLGMGRHSVVLALFEDWHNDKEFLQISREFAFLSQKLN